MRIRANQVFLCLFLFHVSWFMNSGFPVVFLFGQERYVSSPIVLDPPNLMGVISVVAVGDVMLGSWIEPHLKYNGPSYPFEKTVAYLKSADLATANLEAPFTVDGEPFPKKYNFKVPPEYAAGLRGAGFDVVTLANNHMLDFGEQGLSSTLETLDNLGVKYSGAGRNLHEAHQPAILEVGQKTAAFFGYSMTFPKEFYAKEDSSGTAYPEPELMTANLEAWENAVDFTVVSFHWSAEKLEIPKEYQIYFAHLAIDSGADLVLGHHPHVLQGLELYKNRLIAYSLGNFAFGSYSPHAVDSIILRAYLNDEGLLYAHCIPINVDNREVEFQPEVVEGKRKTAIISKLQKLSVQLNGDQDIIADSGMITGDWASFYENWLVHTAVNSYWNVFLESELLTSEQTEEALQKQAAVLDSTN
ncbi:CapA family protein [candidate division KSB1 bacterium]|nr:CapA family protein [candidate division KSB1 bacterium]NIR69228.1 CapA family protein [candidate division KSB1 bacterium]NIS27402.1 CapA family protein [candidate division KSB1 bacterium]NIT74227.1 CapA family protein [candidate division KSB1 bacterium]NIU28119.1 CapA family protein [candidate division KSB1 bacterium]